MDTVDPVKQTLLVLFDNQVARSAAAFEGLTDADLDASPGSDCHTIRGITKHLLGLRKFQLTLLGSPLAAEVPELSEGAPLAEMIEKLSLSAGLIRRGISEYDSSAWFTIPETARPGPWGDEATLARFTRPFNDVTNHLGAIRAIRRIRGNPAARTQ